MAFVKRLLTVQFILAGGNTGQQTQFAEGGGDTMTLSGLRMSAKINKAAGLPMGTMNLKVYGMSLSQMNQLSTLGIRYNTVPKSGVILQAGDSQSGMSTVFQGSVTNGWADFASAPDVPFNVEAHVGLPIAVKNIPPTAYKGTVDIATAMSSFANQMGLKFENNGVSGKLSNPYWWGSPRDQAYAAAQAAGIQLAIDDEILAIWPKGKSRNSGNNPTIGPETGMVGYPSFTAAGLMFRTIFNPSIGIGQTVQVQSSIQPANKKWTVAYIDYDLEAIVHHGEWYQTVYCYEPGTPPLPL